MIEPVPASVDYAVHHMMKHCGRDTLSDPDIHETSTRFWRAWCEMTRGVHVDIPALFRTFENARYDDMVLVSNIPCVSICEHHLLPWHGVAHVAYLPTQRIVGISKLGRVVDAFCRRPQVQERATRQIADAIAEHLQPRGVGVIIEATHSCMTLRGIMATGSITTTSALLGAFREERVRMEFLSLVGKHP